MEYKEIIKKYGGKFGVYRCDCYQLSEKDKGEAFLKAFSDYRDAYNFALQYPKSAIHTIPKTYYNVK